MRAWLSIAYLDLLIIEFESISMGPYFKYTLISSAF